MLVGGLGAGCEPAAPQLVPYEALELPEDYGPEDATLTREQVRLRSRILEVPDEVVLGDTLRYVVELANGSDAPVSLEPCPVYYQAYGESGFALSRTSHLNCDDAPPEIASGAALKFEMELPIEDREAVGVDGSIVWYLGAPDGELRQDVNVSGVVKVVAR